MVLVRYDTKVGAHERRASGRFISCGPDEVGELLVRLPKRSASAASEFRGYTSRDATQKKILRDVFRDGDRYYRSGDLLRCDADGFFYFVDRIGDTFRFKGENVSTTEVAEVLSSVRGVEDIAVVGVEIPGIEGRAGLAVVASSCFDADAFGDVSSVLPAYARPRFVRVVERLPITHTQKIKKAQLAREGVDPATVIDPVLVFVDERYVPLTPARWRAILDGKMRL
jgi:fatty-acyl-CoA synthase